MSSPSSNSTTSAQPISADDIAAAAERRLQQSRQTPSSEIQFSGPEHELRQKFRRLIDPGILRPNAEQQAVNSLKTLLTISENLLREPDNPKFRSFKPTNTIVKKNLIDPKGTVEYARELGFYPDVQNFQPFYTFNPRRMDNLRIGAEILREAVNLGSEKEERAARSKKEEKAAADAVAEKIRLAFEDDRKRKLLRDQMEKEQRDARAASAAQRAALRETAPTAPPDQDGDEDDEAEEPDDLMPGTGNVLGTTSTAVQSRSP
ncbi:hypothetical protein C8J57DRAFT_1293078 [Mycena rebaudengoi]|nr:hypothetical protein C8J57DRAFT_1293078 [Mycena rebaudengoi]